MRDEMTMEERFKSWLIQQGYSESGAAYSYSRAIPAISDHYSKETGENTDIYSITEQTKISAISHDYSQAGRFSEFGYQQHGRFRAAIARYSEFFVHSYDNASDDAAVVDVQLPEAITSFAYEKDLQTTLCAQISELFPEYRIYGEGNVGVEYPIGGKRIDVLLEHSERKDLLIVELKSGRADFKVFGQISMYMGLVKREFPERNVKGIVVAGAIDDSLKYACETNPDVSMKLYRMSIELEDA